MREMLQAIFVLQRALGLVVNHSRNPFKNQRVARILQMLNPIWFPTLVPQSSGKDRDPGLETFIVRFFPSALSHSAITAYYCLMSVLFMFQLV